jgi:hypothetical protein
MKNKSFIYKGLAVTLLAGLSLGNIACSGSYLDEVENSGAFKRKSIFRTKHNHSVHWFPYMMF